jgi:hypothetical protein
MSMKSQVLSVSFHTKGRVDVEPPSVANSLRERAMTSPQAWQAIVDAIIDDVEDEVVKVFFFELSAQYGLLVGCKLLPIFLSIFSPSKWLDDVFFL